MSQATRKLVRDLAAHAEWLAATGVVDLPIAGPRAAIPAEVAARDLSPRHEARVEPKPSVEAKPSTAARLSVEPTLTAGDLDALRAEIGDCQRCRLASGRTQIVFGVGNPSARLLFVGEGPGYEEDQQGIPFVGAAGALLTDIIEKGMRLRRSDVYICNVVKCRPPGNRNPEVEEVEACSPFLVRQIELVAPEVIVALGKFAAQTLLRNDVPITRMRGRWHDYRGIPVMPTFHPAFLLRNPESKRAVWEDVKQVMQRLGLRG